MESVLVRGVRERLTSFFCSPTQLKGGLWESFWVPVLVSQSNESWATSEHFDYKRTLPTTNPAEFKLNGPVF